MLFSDIFLTTTELQSPLNSCYLIISGGLILTMTGSGFSDNIEVLVGAYPCLIIGEVLPDQVTCVIPLYEDAVSGDFIMRFFK